MDEPTNDLDVETLELLEEMVANYAGTLLLVSHDRAFLDNVVTSTLVFEGNGHVNEYVGGYTDWLRQRKVGAQAVARVQPAYPKTASAPSKARRPSYNEQRELAAMPEKIQRLESEQLELQAAISDPNLFKDDPPRGATALQRLQSLAAELETAYSRWDELES
jgi:ATP-binding cassette subfamily F protein uup